MTRFLQTHPTKNNMATLNPVLGKLQELKDMEKHKEIDGIYIKKLTADVANLDFQGADAVAAKMSALEKAKTVRKSTHYSL